MATISAQKLSETLNTLSKKLPTLDLTAAVVDVKAQLETAASTTLGNLPDEIKGGIKGLTQEIDNIADKFLAMDKPTITKLDASIAETVDTLKTTIGSTDLSNMDKVFKNADTTISEIFENAQPALDAASDMLHEVIADGSLEAQLNTLKNVSGKSLDELKSTLTELVDPDKFVGDLDNLINKIDTQEITKEFGNALQRFDKAASDALGGLNSGNLLKDLTEGLTFNIQNAVASVDLSKVNNLVVTNKVLANKITEAKNDLVRNLEIPDVLSGKISEFKTTGGLKKFLDTFTITNEQEALAITSLTNALNQIDTSITEQLGKLSGAVTTADDQTPPNNSPTVDVSARTVSNDVQSIVNSKEELIKYFQACTRDISTMMILFAETTLDYSGLTAQDAALTYKKDYGFVPYHFWIRKDGTIETLKSINEELRSSIIEEGSNSAKYGVGVLLNAGYDEYQSNGNNPPLSKLTSKSITRSQMDSLHKLVSAFYAYLPVADVYSYQDLVSKEYNPGFSMDEIISRSPYNAVNSKHHEETDNSGDWFLSPDDLISQYLEKNESTKKEVSDTQ